MLTILLAVAAASWTDFDDADARLNGDYRAVMAHLAGPEKISLRADQRRWIEERNRICGVETRGLCSTKLTVTRANELERQLERTVTFRTLSDKQLFALERVVDDVCRGTGQDGDGPVCRRRDALVTALGKRGWCWGPDDAYGYQRHWMRVGATCHN